MPRSNFCEDCHRECLEKVWLKENHNCRRSCQSHVKCPMSTKTKKKVKIQKSRIFKNGKNGLEIWWLTTFPQNSGLIRVTGFLRKRVLRTTDARATALALLTQSSRAKKELGLWMDGWPLIHQVRERSILGHYTETTASTQTSSSVGKKRFRTA